MKSFMKKNYISILCFTVAVMLLVIIVLQGETADITLPTGTITIICDFEEGEKRIVIDDEEEIALVNCYLSGWDTSMYRHKIRDLLCEIEIQFETGDILYVARKENYGRVKGDNKYGYCFPEDFINWVREKTK